MMTDQAPAPDAGGPVEDYLDRLLMSLSGQPRYVRHTLAEVEAHLHDAVADELAAGRTQLEAEHVAVARIGAVHAVTGHTELFSRPSAAVVRRTTLAGSLIGGVALMAYALSAGISWALAAIRGGEFVTAPFPPGSYTAADCTHWLAGDPSTHNCLTAMTSDHVADIILQGTAAGFLGLIALLAFWIMRQRWQDRGTLIALPVGSAEAVGVILALLVAFAGAGNAVDLETIERGVGAGQPIAIAIAALCAAAFFAVRLYRGVRTAGWLSRA
jgi:hypothetical protein